MSSPILVQSGFYQDGSATSLLASGTPRMTKLFFIQKIVAVFFQVSIRQYRHIVFSQSEKCEFESQSSF